MKARHSFGLAWLGVWLALAVTAGAAAPVRLGIGSDGPLADLPSDAGDVLDHPALTVTPFDGKINVAITGNDESDPAVALCASNRYLAVYERGNQIYGQRMDSQGALLSDAFLVSDGFNPDSRPDVACEWTNDYFVVVWESAYSGSDDDIRAQAVYGDHQVGSQLRGSSIYVAWSVNNERNPAVACNSDDQTCLVAYEYRVGTTHDICGRRVEVSGAGLATPQVSFEISGATREYNPDLAWAEAAYVLSPLLPCSTLISGAELSHRY